MKLLILLSILIHLYLSDDMIRDHLNQFIDRSIPPCDDFYHHVCSRNMNKSDSIISKSQRFYRDIILKLGSPKTADSLLYNKSVATWKEPLDISNLDGNSSEISKEVCEHVNSLIGKKSTRNLYMAAKFYAKIHERIAFIEYLKEDGIEEKLPLKRMNDMAKLVRDKIRKTLEATKWVEGIVTFPGGHGLNATAVLDSIHFLNEEIPSELNTTSLKNLSRIYTEIYEEENRMRVNSGCEECDDLAVFLPAYKRLQTELHSSYDVNRIRNSGIYNAWFHPAEQYVYIQEPVYYPLLDCDSTTNDLNHMAIRMVYVTSHNFTGMVGHSLVRSVSREFDEQAACLIKHYQNTCAKFGAERCNSGVETFNEDGPDSAGIRVIVDLMKDIYGDSIDILEYPDLGITKKQALFYGIAARKCRPQQENFETSGDVHSLSRIRVNGMFSQSADFASAFSCKNGDRMVVSEDQVCHLFGEFA